MFITHDMGVVAEIADDVLVMHHGKVVESGPVDTIFHAPQDDYTQDAARLGAEARGERRDPPASARRSPPTQPPVLEVGNLRMHFGSRQRSRSRRSTTCRSRSGSSETLGIVGEIGLGQDDARPLHAARLRSDRAGASLSARGRQRRRSRAPPTSATLKPCRREIRMIFQDPFASLNPRMTVAQIIGEPLLSTASPTARSSTTGSPS